MIPRWFGSGMGEDRHRRLSGAYFKNLSGAKGDGVWMDALVYLQDDFLACARKSSDILIISVRGIYPCGIRKVLCRFFKSDCTITRVLIRQ